MSPAAEPSTSIKRAIALVEAQGYLFAGLLAAASVADTLGHVDTARRSRERASRLRERFEADFWMEPEGFYALALDGDDRPCVVISSNPGHCLWSGIASRPARVILDMFDVTRRLGWVRASIFAMEGPRSSNACATGSTLAW
jgi:glycogen debranching enzyme